MSGDPTATRMNHVSANRRKNRPVLCDAAFMTSEKVRVVVGDDHPLFRDGVVRALTSSGSIEVVAEAEDGISALEAWGRAGGGRRGRRWWCGYGGGPVWRRARGDCRGGIADALPAFCELSG